MRSPQQFFTLCRCGLHFRGRCLVVLGCAFLTLAVMFAGVNWQELCDSDEAYQLLCCRFYRSAPMGMLSFYDGWLWSRWAGDGVTAMRFLNQGVNLLAIFLCGLYALRLTRRLVPTAALVLLTALISRLAGWHLYGWDSGCFPFVALGLIATVSYLGRPRLWKALVMGSAAAAMTLSRVPLLAILIVMLITVIYARRHQRQAPMIAADCFAGLAAFVASAWALACLMCGSLEAYLASFVPENMVSGHGAAQLLKVIFWTMKVTLPELAVMGTPLLACVAIAWAMQRIPRPWGWRDLICASLAVCLYGFLVLRFSYQGAPDFFWPMIGWGIWPMLLPMGWLPLRRWLTGAKCVAPTPYMAVIAGFMLVMALGSDQPWNRVWHLRFALPLIIALLWPCLNRADRRLWRLALGLCLVCSFVACGAKLYYFSQYNPTRIDMLPLHEHMRGSDQYLLETKQLQSALARYDIGPADLQVIGGGRYGIYYCFTDSKPADFHHFHWGDGEPSTLQATRAILASNPRAVVVATRFGNYLEPIAELQRYGYHQVETTPQFHLFVKISEE